jgi:hypothetical protein
MFSAFTPLVGERFNSVLLVNQYEIKVTGEKPNAKDDFSCPLDVI